MVQISNEWLLSAAQCVDGKHAAAIQVEISLALFSSSMLSQSFQIPLRGLPGKDSKINRFFDFCTSRNRI